jgi:hypothetical protein
MNFSPELNHWADKFLADEAKLNKMILRKHFNRLGKLLDDIHPKFLAVVKEDVHETKRKKQPIMRVYLHSTQYFLDAMIGAFPKMRRQGTLNVWDIPIAKASDGLDQCLEHLGWVVNISAETVTVNEINRPRPEPPYPLLDQAVTVNLGHIVERARAMVEQGSNWVDYVWIFTNRKQGDAAFVSLKEFERRYPGICQTRYPIIGLRLSVGDGWPIYVSYDVKKDELIRAYYRMQRDTRQFIAWLHTAAEAYNETPIFTPPA